MWHRHTAYYVPRKEVIHTKLLKFFGGRVLELCSGAIQTYIKLRSGKSLKPVGKSNPATPDTKEWITPKVYKGASEMQDDSQDTLSCERCDASFPKSERGATGLVPTPIGIVRLCVDCALKFI
jgi:hypothetical protein